jgi:TonB family protein
MKRQPVPASDRRPLLALSALFVSLAFFAFRQLPPSAGALPQTATSKPQGDLNRKAAFKGKAGTITEFVRQNVRYPQAGAGLPTEGNIGLRFTVMKDGTLEKVEVMERQHPALEQEAVRLLKATSGSWEPALVNGKPVTTQVSLHLPVLLFTPVTFPSAPENTIYTRVEQMPTFKGGEAGLNKFLATNVRYPAAPQKSGPQGLVVVVSFVIKQDGSLEDFQVIKSLHPDLDQEALRVAKKMEGMWTPGKQRGKNVTVRHTLPVRFSLNK